MKLHSYFDQNSPEHVILHAQYRAKRGKRPSMSFNGINNPREALKAAKAKLDDHYTWTMSSRTQGFTTRVAMQITEALGMRPLTLAEVKHLLETPLPVDSSARVPYLFWHGPEAKLRWCTDREEIGARQVICP